MVANLPFVIFYYGIGLFLSYNFVKVDAVGVKDSLLTILAVMNLWPVILLSNIYVKTKKDELIF